MYVKSLSLRGFKSFATPTHLQFSPGIAGIVGPNGSGKSNLVDALAWVMGEQGAKNLRGGQMTDVIFAGNAKRGAAARAQVELTIDNTAGDLPIEYSEVTISRTLLRSGGSEYAINATPCRLLDIQELLSDTGMGRNMHVLVGQGQLDQVLSADPQQRRALVEEAAGVLKHQQRKDRAERKIKKLDEKLSRLQDLTREIHRQLGPLARQAKTARRATILQATIRDYQARLLADDLAQRQAELAHNSLEYERLQAQRQAGQQETEKLAAQLAQRQQELADSEVAAALSRQGQQLTGLVERFHSLDRLAGERHQQLSQPLPAPSGPNLSERQQQVNQAQQGLMEAEQRLAAAQEQVALEQTAQKESRQRVADLVQVTAQARAQVAQVAEESARLTARQEQEKVRWEGYREAGEREIEKYSALVEQITAELVTVKTFLPDALGNDIAELLRAEITVPNPELAAKLTALILELKKSAQNPILTVETDLDSRLVSSFSEDSEKSLFPEGGAAGLEETVSETMSADLSNGSDSGCDGGENPYLQVYRDCQKTVDDLKKSLVELQRKYQKMQAEVAKKESRCEYLRQASRKFSSAAQEALHRHPNTICQLSQLLTVPREAAAAVSALLSGFEQAAVFATAAAAAEAVAELPGEGGNARWWVLDQPAVVPQDLGERLNRSNQGEQLHQGEINAVEEVEAACKSPRRLGDMVQTHPAIQTGMAEFLGDWMLVADDQAAAATLEEHPEQRLVTAAGNCWTGYQGQAHLVDPHSHLLVEQELAVAQRELLAATESFQLLERTLNRETESLAAAEKAVKDSVAAVEAENKRREQIAAEQARQAALAAKLAAQKAREQAEKMRRVTGQITEFRARCLSLQDNLHRYWEAAKKTAAARQQYEMAQADWEAFAAVREENNQGHTNAEQLAELEQRLSQARGTEQNIAEKLTQARLAEAAAVEAVKQSQRRLQGARQGLADYRISYASWQNKQIKRRQELAKLELLQAEVQKVVTVAEDCLTAVTERQLQVETIRQQLNQDLHQLRESLHREQTALAQITEAAHTAQLQLAQVQVRVEQLTEQAQEDFGLKAAELLAEYGPEQPVPLINEENWEEILRFQAETIPAEEAAPSEINTDRKPQLYPPEYTVSYQREQLNDWLLKAQNQLQRLGKINPLALAEHEALEERYRFLTGQVQDIEQSKTDLLGLIKEVEEQVQAAFVNAYQDIERAFQEVFKILFPGGEGKISLTDPEDLLTTGIEVSVRPAGKKVKRLSLLSGGERSLAALAFLFAIFTARPSPFYILDEVEAALDDMNLSRILDLFKQQQDRSQLIIITHQKRTMEIADVLYGITMRDGVSQAISHRMTDF